MDQTCSIMNTDRRYNLQSFKIKIKIEFKYGKASKTF